MKRSAFLLIILLIAGIYFFTRKEPSIETSTAPKQILGSQEQAQEEPQFEIYKTKKGDTLFNISQKYDISWKVLAEINNLKEPYILKIGQEIKIPNN